jgi:hypothetical protein
MHRLRLTGQWASSPFRRNAGFVEAIKASAVGPQGPTIVHAFTKYIRTVCVLSAFCHFGQSNQYAVLSLGPGCLLGNAVSGHAKHNRAERSPCGMSPAVGCKLERARVRLGARRGLAGLLMNYRRLLLGWLEESGHLGDDHRTAEAGRQAAFPESPSYNSRVVSSMGYVCTVHRGDRPAVTCSNGGWRRW